MKKILICEDSPTLINFLKKSLSKEGYEVSTADNGQEALQLARNESPDLILLDLMLPQIDGLKICRMLKFDEKYKDIPIVMFTAKGEESDQQLGYEVGADAYIPKSIGPVKLLEKIRDLLEKGISS